MFFIGDMVIITNEYSSFYEEKGIISNIKNNIIEVEINGFDFCDVLDFEFWELEQDNKYY